MKKDQIKADGDRINRITKSYSSGNKAHFEALCDDEGGSFISIGGRVDLIGAYIAETIVRVVMNTPALDEGFINMIADAAKDGLRKARKEVQ